MIKSYDFVPFLKCKVYHGNGNLEGRILIRVKVLTPVHIFSGHFRVQDNGKIYREFIKTNGRPIIPGTSFKGCIRTIAESVSYSCLQTSLPHEKLPTDKRHDGQHKCIICDMFGGMGNKSKIRFSDLVAVNYKTEVRGIPRSFRPHPESNYYMENGKYKGYKFYKHGINGIQPSGPILCEFVNAGSEFEGEVIYRGLTDEQVRLLCFALGLSGDIQPKIGYGKPYFYGSIEINSQPEWADKAREYVSECDDEVRKNISALIRILNYSNALKSYEG
ncbi:CRISPR/Cas system CSM-associated protein Csm3 (group 7 of RAMP superfamily) [Caldicoprobacter guelmensis]|uniref:RAMP superfamily CRISPR-associated protein n=1 Tax=Caldicoprobacter guelmensis TaxID=1170224 RepID=UPI00195D9404|nr:RAMP superfamily CRISPR-associated protein [Caldicoprobacter guelmensis]MBM7582859.1 CRISPR/Cas system CSM-associated protein Csm3 (group 7 of RAMP superfamily) [Caldicoprobacter guelmensis]